MTCGRSSGPAALAKEAEVGEAVENCDGVLVLEVEKSLVNVRSVQGSSLTTMQDTLKTKMQIRHVD